MRLKCPSCGAEYEVAAHLIPQGGRHVQCTACHTRWFVNPAQESEPSEDRIIERLEAWSSRPRPVPVPVPQPAPPGTAGRGAEDPDSGEVFVWESPAAA
ncbi:MAG TPA: zinc-ribbon domain-containing protein, partial [Amaricoccus sp.]|nr:zinc-ribbon domain-containing protein [Amaricoccus sp.]